jgi:hypothetical protein
MDAEHEMEQLAKQMVVIMQRMEELKRQKDNTPCPTCGQKRLKYQDWNKLHDAVNMLA